MTAETMPGNLRTLVGRIDQRGQLNVTAANMATMTTRNSDGVEQQLQLTTAERQRVGAELSAAVDHFAT